MVVNLRLESNVYRADSNTLPVIDLILHRTYEWRNNNNDMPSKIVDVIVYEWKNLINQGFSKPCKQVCKYIFFFAKDFSQLPASGDHLN